MQRSFFVFGALMASVSFLGYASSSTNTQDLLRSISDEVDAESLRKRDVNPKTFDYEPDNVKKSLSSYEGVKSLSVLLYPNESGEIAYSDLALVAAVAAPSTKGMILIPEKRYKVRGGEQDYRNNPVPTVNQDGKQIISNFPKKVDLAPFERGEFETVEKGFYIDRLAVSNREYKDFIMATGHPAPRHWDKKTIPQGLKDEPVVNITYEDAVAFANWRGKRLPKLSEYERAVRKNASIRQGAPLREWSSTVANPGRIPVSYFIFGDGTMEASKSDQQTGFRTVLDE